MKQIKNLCYEEFRQQALAKLSEQMDDPTIPNSEKLRLAEKTVKELKEKEKEEEARVQNIRNILGDRDDTDEEKLQKLEHLLFTDELREAGQCTDINRNSLHFILRVTQPSALERIWQKSISGQLTRAFYNEFVTPQFRRKFDLKKITIVVSISEAQYLRCKKALLARGECFNPPAVRLFAIIYNNIVFKASVAGYRDLFLQITLAC